MQNKNRIFFEFSLQTKHPCYCVISSKQCDSGVKSPKQAFREFSPPRYGLLTHLNEHGGRPQHWQTVKKQAHLLEGAVTNYVDRKR